MISRISSNFRSTENKVLNNGLFQGSNNSSCPIFILDEPPWKDCIPTGASSS